MSKPAPRWGRRASRSARRVLLRVAVVLASALSPAAQAGDGVERSGDVLRLALPAAALGMTIHHDDAPGRRQFFTAFAANAAATWLLKATVDKARPDGRDDDAFPSGHASMAFQAAGFIQRRYGGRAAWLAYALAGYTGWTRVHADQHDTVDVLAGAALGVASAYLLVDRFPGVDVGLTFDRQIGIRLSARL